MHATKNFRISVVRFLVGNERNKVLFIETHEEKELPQFRFFERNVAKRLQDLLGSLRESGDSIFSLSSLHKLLDIFFCCLEEFRLMLEGKPFDNGVSCPDRYVSHMLYCCMKTLDVCNEAVQGVEIVTRWQKQAEIAVSALTQSSSVKEWQLQRAKRALKTLTGVHAGVEAHGSSGRKNSSGKIKSRFLRSILSHLKSASKGIQTVIADFVAPMSGEATGFRSCVCAMTMLLAFVTWILENAFPCDNHSDLGMYLAHPPKHQDWAKPMIALQQMIEEARREIEGRSLGCLSEMQSLDKCRRVIVELDECSSSASMMGVELGDICRRLGGGLIPLQLKIRETCRRIISSRVIPLAQTNRIL